MIIPVANVTGQYNHLITRILNEIGVKSELVPISITKEELEKMGADGLVMGGGPQRISEEWNKLGNLPNIIKEIKIPMFGICLTHQLISIVFGGKAGQAKSPEYGPVKIFIDNKDQLLEGFGDNFTAWETHNDEIKLLPKDFENLAHSEKCKFQVIRHKTKPIFGTQFHPEVIHTENGRLIFENFAKVCKNE
jgi:GMP synthase (glutamine-hydrolysing)